MLGRGRKEISQEERFTMEVSEVNKVIVYHNDGGDHTIPSFFLKPIGIPITKSKLYYM